MNITNITDITAPIVLDEAKIISEYCSNLEPSINLIILLAFLSFFLESFFGELSQLKFFSRYKRVLIFISEILSVFPFLALGYLTYYGYLKGAFPLWVYLIILGVIIALIGFIIYKVGCHFKWF